MNIFGIICEYNPLHTGHVYQIAQTREMGADAIVCVLSGNFVQRADFALFSKHMRAECAIQAGADLVIELPTPWAISSAEGFARGAVGLLNTLGVITSLSFGCETDDITRIQQTAQFLLHEDYHTAVREALKTGVSFASAREKAVRSFSPELSEVLKTPNNILAVEYLKALIMQNSNIKPHCVLRQGAAHDASSLSHPYLSASTIRRLIIAGDLKKAYEYMPEACAQRLNREFEHGSAPVLRHSADTAILAFLKRMTEEDFKKISDVSEGLEVRLVRAIRNASTLDEAIEWAKTKRYAHSRIRRIFLAAFLGITRDMSENMPKYARVLAFNHVGRTVLKQCRNRASIPIITKPADAHRFGVAAEFEQEAMRSELYSLFMPKPKTGMRDWTTSPIYIPTTATARTGDASASILSGNANK